MFDAQRGLAATSGGRWLDTGNAGRDWRLRPDSARLAGSLQDLQFTPDGTGWVVGLVQQPALVFGPRPSPKGPLYRSVDQGRTWRAVELPAALAGTVQGLQFVDDRHGFLRAATGCSSIGFYTSYEQQHTTSDTGATWRAVGSERAAGVPPSMRSATQGVLVSPPTVRASSRVFTTNDGGSTWSAGTELPNGYTLTAQRLIAVGDRLWLLGAAQLLSSGDGGRSWAPVALPLPEDRPPDGIASDPLLKDITFADARNGWIVGRDGLVLATTDGGATWVRQATGTRQTLLTARATGAQTAWIGGTSRAILATVSGGR